MVVGEMPEAVDLLIVGAGPAGVAAALEGARLGRDVLLVDRHAPLDASAAPWRDPGTAEAARALLEEAGVRTRIGDLTFVRRRVAVIRTDADLAEFLEFADVVIATGRTSNVRRTAVTGEGGADVLPLGGPIRGEVRAPGPVVVVGSDAEAIERARGLAGEGYSVTCVVRPPAGDPIALRLLAEVVLRPEGVVLLAPADLVGLGPGHVLVDVGGDVRRVPAIAVLADGPWDGRTAELGLESLGVDFDGEGRVGIDVVGLLAPHVAAAGQVVDPSCGPGRATAEGRAAAATVSGRPTPRPAVAADLTGERPTPYVVVAPAHEDSASVGVGTTVVRLVDDGGGRVVTAVQQGTGRLVAAVCVGRDVALADALLVAIEMGATVEDLSLMSLPARGDVGGPLWLAMSAGLALAAQRTEEASMDGGST
jgi:dihydrolipoamide dehydrogenase